MVSNAMTKTESAGTAAAGSAKFSKAGRVLDFIAKKIRINIAGMASLTRMKNVMTDSL